MAQAPDVKSFKADFEKLLAGKMNEEKSALFRACWGLHHTKDGGWILKFRFPGGQMTPDHAAGMGRFLREWTSDPRSRITPRQNVQVFDFPAAKVPQAIEALPSYGLSTWRHPGAALSASALCEKGGYCENTKIDPRPLLNALETWLQSHGEGFPSKFKVAFSACGNDCAYAGGHDVGLVAVLGPGEQTGFQVLVGGRLGEDARPAVELAPFVPEMEAGPFLGAVVEVAKRLAKGDRTMRLGHLVAKVGKDAFLEEVNKTKINDFPALVKETPRLSDPVEDGIPMTVGDEYKKFQDTNLFPQKDGHHYVAIVRVPYGWVTASQWEVLAKVSREFSNGELRLTQSQNVMLPMLHESVLKWVHYDLHQYGLGLAGAGFISDLSCCPGPKSCDTARDVTAHEALARFFAMGDLGIAPEDLAGVVKVSSCPNKCGNPELASLGLVGASWGDAKNPKTGYRILMGGGKSPSGTKIGREVGACRTERLGGMLRSVLERFKTERQGDENFHQFCQRVSQGDPSPAQVWLHTYTEETPFGEGILEVV